MIFGLLNGLSKANKSTEYIELFVRYLMSTVESTKSDDLKKEIVKSLKNGGNAMPSIAEKLINEGIEQGIEKGIERGVERGIEKGIEQNQLQITAKMIQNGMSNADIRKITGLSMRKIEEIGKKLRT